MEARFLRIFFVHFSVSVKTALSLNTAYCTHQSCKETGKLLRNVQFKQELAIGHLQNIPLDKKEGEQRSLLKWP